MPEERLNLFEAVGQAFGFVSKKRKVKELPSIVTKKDEYDGAVEISPVASGVYGHYLDIDGKITNDFELIGKYRELAQQPEIDFALSDIVNDAIVIDNVEAPVSLDLDKIEKFSDKIKETITNEFDELIKLLNFNNKGGDIFKQWYIDGRLYYHTIIDEKNPREGIQEIRNVDPRRIKKVREVKKEKLENGVEIINGHEEYYVYNSHGFGSTNPVNNTNLSTQLVRLSSDLITYITSGLTTPDNTQIISHLHKAIKPMNQLRMLEDSVVIYRLARAPERRIFYIDTGNLPTHKAEEYIQQVKSNFKNKLVYDVVTGNLRDDKRHMSMLEDLWLGRKEGSRGTEVVPLPSGQNLGEMTDVEYFKKRLMKALNVPYSRLDSETQWTLGRATEITRDEVRFAHFIQGLRNKFNELFDSLLQKQLTLKGIITDEDWKEIQRDINYKYSTDSYFFEMKKLEVIKEKFTLLQMVDLYSPNGSVVDPSQKTPYISFEWINQNVLFFTDEEIKIIEKQKNKDMIEKENDAMIAQREQMALQAATEPDPKENAPSSGGSSKSGGGTETSNSGKGQKIKSVKHTIFK